MRRLVLALLVAAPGALAQSPSARMPAAATLDSAGNALRNAVITAEMRFLFAWDTLWMRSERARHSFIAIGDLLTEASPRRQAYHCHPDHEMASRGGMHSRLIKNASGVFAVCPSFDLGDVATFGDERTRLDDALIDSLIPEARRLRADLIAVLDSAAVQLEADDFIVGQRVRFLMDQWEQEKAMRVARDCRATQWWCSALAGYVLAMRAQTVAADSAFTAAFAQMPPKDRCRWNDNVFAIDFASRIKYAAFNCAARDSVNQQLWWLADPLFIEPGNERKVEQHLRAVMLQLRTALERDERYTWGKDPGDDAHQVMLVRYGWPAFSHWGGPFEDRSHTGYLAQRGTPANEPYTTYEYTGARAHTIPVWDAIERPFAAVPGDWTLIAPDKREPVAPRSLTRDEPPTPPRSSVGWWPVEHFAPRRAIVQMYGGQHAMLRREGGVLLAVATQLDADRLRRRPTDSIPSVELVTSDGPEKVQRIATKKGAIGTVLELHDIIPSRPVLAGLEYPSGGGRGGPAGRLRFGLTPPQPLSAMQNGEHGISDPVILLAPSGTDETPNEIEAVLRRMAPSHVVSEVKKIGVYWETYGFEPADSVELAVWIERYTPQGIGRRFGIAFGVTQDLNTPIAITWKEPQPGYRSHVFRQGRVSVIGRGVTVDVSALPPGDYRLEVAVRKGTGEPLRGRSTFVVK